MRDNLRSILKLPPVKCCDYASVRDQHWHRHLQVKALVTFGIWKGSTCKFGIASELNRSWVTSPSLHVFDCDVDCPILNHGDGDAVLIPGLSSNVVPGRILEHSVISFKFCPVLFRLSL